MLFILLMCTAAAFVLTKEKPTQDRADFKQPMKK